MNRSPSYVSPGHLDWVVLPPTNGRRLILVITYAGHSHAVRFTARHGDELQRWFADQWDNPMSSLHRVNLEPIWERLARAFEATAADAARGRKP